MVDYYTDNYNSIRVNLKVKILTYVDGHYFNVINNKETIKFLDFQKNIGERLMNPLDFSQYKSFTLMITR